MTDAAPREAAPPDSAPPARAVRGRPLLDAVLILIVIGSFTAACSRWQVLQRFDWAIYDFVIDLLPVQSSHTPVLIAIDERSIEAIGSWPWPRAVYAQALERLRAAGVARIGIDVLMTEGAPTRSADDAALAAAIAAAPQVYMPVAIDERSAAGQLIEVLPAPDFIAAGVQLGHVHVEADDDGVVRGVYLWQGIDDAHWPHLALALASGGTPARPPHDAPMSTANVRRDYRMLRFVAGAGALPRISFVDLLAARVRPVNLRGATVLIGMTAAAGADTLATPVTRDGRPMAGVEFNANLYTAIRAGALVTPLSPAGNAAVCTLLALLPMLLLPRLRPRGGLIATASLALLPVLFAVLALRFANLWFAPMAAIAGAAIAYPLWSWRRLDQTIGSVRREIEALRVASVQTQLLPDTANDPEAARFINALVAGELNANGEPQLPALLPRGADAWLRKYRTLHVATAPAPGDSFEVLTRGLDALHVSIARQGQALASAQRGLAGMRDAVMLLGDFGHVLFANPAARTLFGVGQAGTHAELDVLSMLATLTPSLPHSWTSVLRALYLEHQDQNLEARTADARELLVHAARLSNGAVLTLIDISRLRQAERAHRETLSFLSHDLRSPIVSLLALSGGLRDRHPDPDIQDTLLRMQHYAQRSLENAEQFLQMARIENEPEFTAYEIDLLAAAENAAAQLTDQATLLGSRIEVRTRTTEGVWVLGYGEFLERALMNLIGNALKYGPPGDTVEVLVLENEHEAICEVRDHGAGIAAAELPHLFEPYYQGQAHRGRPDGVGLGLRFVAVVAQRFGGRVEVNSERGGACFRFVLPRVQLQ